jgi:hypothetical protein
MMDKLIENGASEYRLLYSTPQKMYRILYDLFKLISGTKSPDQKMIATKLLYVCLMSSESLNLMDDLIVSSHEWQSVFKFAQRHISKLTSYTLGMDEPK